MPTYPNSQGNPLSAIPVYMGGPGASPVASLDAASAVVQGKPILFGAARQNIAMQTVYTGSPANGSVIVNLMGTIDGTTFFILETFAGPSGGVVHSNNIPVVGARADLMQTPGGTDVTSTIVAL